jgi:secondary thiamine-phosphate synthase enzyme
MKHMRITTNNKREVINITDRVSENIPAGEGVLSIFVRHTTAAITTADLDPGTDLDFLDFLQAITPQVQWRHPHDPAHAPDHMLASLIGPSVSVPYKDGQLLLGEWQRIILVELDGPREREIVIV